MQGNEAKEEKEDEVEEKEKEEDRRSWNLVFPGGRNNF